MDKQCRDFLGNLRAISALTFGCAGFAVVSGELAVHLAFKQPLQTPSIFILFF